MHPNFVAATDSLHDSFERLINSEPIPVGHRWPREKMAGVYLFSEGDIHHYVGRTNDFKGRYGRHCNPGATHRMAAFAFRLARIETGNLKASYKPDGKSRNALALEESFKAAFIQAKAKIRSMDFRIVEENCPLRQCLLEIYCAVALGTKHNDFDNH